MTWPPRHPHHLWFSVPPTLPLSPTQNKEIADATEHEANDIVDCAVEMAEKVGVTPLKVALNCGGASPREAICKFAKDCCADNLVLASSGKGQVGRLLMGSVADYCAHHAECPVTVIPPSPTLTGSGDKDAEDEAGMDGVYQAWYKVCAIKDEADARRAQSNAVALAAEQQVITAQAQQIHRRHIYVAVDGSDESEKAYMWAVNHILRAGDTLTLVCAFTPVEKTARMRYFVAMGAFSLTQEDAEEFNEDITCAAESYCHSLLRSCPAKVEADVVICEGDPRDVLIEMTQQTKAEKNTMLIVGSRGRGAIQRALLGSTSEHILHHHKAGSIVVCK